MTRLRIPLVNWAATGALRRGLQEERFILVILVPERVPGCRHEGKVVGSFRIQMIFVDQFSRTEDKWYPKRKLSRQVRPFRQIYSVNRLDHPPRPDLLRLVVHPVFHNLLYHTMNVKSLVVGIST